MYHVEADGLYYEQRRLGPRTALYVDTSELPSLTAADGVIRSRTPGRVDVVFAAGERVALCESKRPQDLVDSTRKRRLHRQLRTLLRLAGLPRSGNVVALLLKGGTPDFNDRDVDDVVVNLVRLQCLGVVLLPVPSDDSGVAERLGTYKTFLDEQSRAPLAAIAGSDPTYKTTGTVAARVKGLGAARLDRLVRLAISRCTDEELREAVKSKKLVRELRKVVK